MRALRITLIVAVILGGLFVAADRLAVKLAEQEAADRIRSSQGLTGTPHVSIKGFPFLTQVLGKKLDEVDVNLDGVTASAGGHSIRVTELNARLRDVRLENNYSSATADVASGSARISYADLTKAAPKGVTVSYAGRDKAGAGQVKVSGSVSDLLGDLGIEVPSFASGALQGRNFTTYSSVAISGGDTVRLHADALPQLPLPGLESKLREVVDFGRELSGLPRGLELDKVTADQDGVKVSVTGRNIPLAG